MSVTVTTSAGNTVTATTSGGTTVSFVSSSSSVSVSSPATQAITVTDKGPKGDTGATGATGATGPQGPAGASGTTFTAGDGLDLTTGTLSADLKSDGGLVIESNKLAVDLGASSVTGTLAIGDGGTGSTTASGARSALGVDAAGTDNSTNVTLAGTPDYITISGQEITRNQIDLAADVTGTLPVGNGGTGATTLASNSVLTGNGTSAITAESNLTYDGTNLELTASGISAPDLTLTSTASFSSGSNFIFKKDRADDSPNDGDVIGLIQWQGQDDAGNSQNYVNIIGSIEESGSGTEGGQFVVSVANHDGGLETGLDIRDGDANGELDVTIASGANSVTTINGKLDVTTDATGIPFTTSIKSDDIYVAFVSAQNNWYGAGYVGQTAGTSIGDETIAVSNRMVSFIAPKACKVNSVYAVGYFSSTATWEFGFYKVPFVDDSNSDITWAEITSTDNDGSKTASKTYKLNWDLSGDNANLSAGDGLAFVFRRTDATGTVLFYGNVFADLQYT